MPDELTDAGTQTFTEASYPMLAYILSLQETGTPDDLATMRGRFRTGVAEVRRKAEEWGIARWDAYMASFALVAFADETAVKLTGACKGMWPLLQYEYFGTHHAGEEYFAYLDKIQGDGSAAARWRDPTKGNLLELYFLCLFLGFRGRWAASTTDEVQVELDYFRKYVRSKPLGLLSPHGIPQGPQRPPRGDRQTWRWVGLGVHLALLLTLGLFAVRSLGLV